MFYRGFLQAEFRGLTGTPFAAIPLSTAAFAFSHAPGSGRISAAVAGAYLGFLAEKNHGRLGPGIAVHFWSDLLLGAETVLLYAKAQRATPPTGFTVQINY
jgi:membrane protease YdiL (CAAX protease family)